MNKVTKLLCATFVALSAFSLSARAATAASDAASNYNGTWTGNGGSGFGGWSFSTAPNSGFFLGPAPVSGINTSGTSFGLFANTGATASAVDTFTAGSSGSVNLQTGQSFSLTLSIGTVQNGGTVGFGLQNSSAANEFEFYFVGGGTDFTINAGGVVTDTGIGYTTDALRVSYTQLSGTNYSVKVTDLTTNGAPQTFTGTVNSADISQVRTFNANAGSGSAANFYVNSLQVIPEPSSVALMLTSSVFGSFYLLRRRRRFGASS